MHLTQPDTRCSVMGIRKTIPKAWLNSKNDLPLMKLAEITCSSCAGKTVSPVLNAEVKNVAYEQRVNPLCFLSPSNFNITGNCFSRQPPAVDNMVSRDVVYICVQKNGTSALSLQRALGLGSYRTAWMCLHKLRHSMVRPQREKLSGAIEVDETYVGGEKPGKRGRGTEGKDIVVIAAERED